MSSPRLTAVDVRGMYARAVRAAKGAGLDVTTWRLVSGSNDDGISYRLYSGTGSEPFLGVGSGSFLGFRIPEVVRTLECYAIAWEAVAARRVRDAGVR